MSFEPQRKAFRLIFIIVMLAGFLVGTGTGFGMGWIARGPQEHKWVDRWWIDYVKKMPSPIITVDATMRDWWISYLHQHPAPVVMFDQRLRYSKRWNVWEGVWEFSGAVPVNIPPAGGCLVWQGDPEVKDWTDHP